MATAGKCETCQMKSPPDSIYVLNLCQHMHCAKCILVNLEKTLIKVTFTPVPCCEVQNIPQQIVNQIATREQISSYKLRLLEYYQTAKDRLYCAVCRAYIPIEDYRSERSGRCNTCGWLTCRRCRLKSHFGTCRRRLEIDTLAGSGSIGTRVEEDAT